MAIKSWSTTFGSVPSNQQTTVNLILTESWAGVKIASKSGLASATTAKYDYIVGKYYVAQHLSTYNDFMNRNPSAVGTNAVSIITGNSNNASIIITVISVLSLTALGGFFFIKKKKEQ